jgi:hypothetical protein
MVPPESMHVQIAGSAPVAVEYIWIGFFGGVGVAIGIVGEFLTCQREERAASCQRRGAG